MRSTRVAFSLIDGTNWTGGYNYLVNLLGTIAGHEASRIAPVLFVGECVSDAELAPLVRMKNVELVRSSVFDFERAGARIAKALLTGADAAAIRSFRKQGIDVVFESATFYGWRSPFPTIAWIPDFQHRRLRARFKVRAFWRRELGFRSQVMSNRFIMLSSEDARRDCELFYPGSIGRTAVIRFATSIDPILMETEPGVTARSYGLTQPFFYLPNQFWTHKNHLAVIEALGILRQEGRDVFVAASGNPLDWQHPDHFAALEGRAAELGVAEHFRCLGMIPRAHVVSLLRSCSALINPSFFEGWSTTVEEARALGVPMLLSSIAVHREQMGDRAQYFDPSNPRELADALWYARHTAPTIMPCRRIDPGNDHNLQRFADDFHVLVDRAASGV